MAYSTSNPPALVTQRMAGNPSATQVRMQIWEYLSTDAMAVVMATNYISNAQDLGMFVGDIVLVSGAVTGIPTISWARVTQVTATGSILSTGLAIT